MLTCHVSTTSPTPAEAAGREGTWFDLVGDDVGERARVERATGLHLPDREHLGGIELSNRVGIADDALRLGIPYFSADDDAAPSPVGIVLTPRHLVSLRYAPSPAFDLAAERVRASVPGTSTDAFVVLVQSIIGRTADGMEAVAAEGGSLSARIFGDGRRRTSLLRAMLAEIGRVEARLTRMRLSATGLLRIVLALREAPPAWIPKPALARLHAAQKDLDVLCEFDGQLTDKLQFLLDAVLGFINIDQNDVIKILTVASVVSIPPVILAGIWGMNFDHMPELHAPHAYPLALLAIALSIVLPLLWFKRRNWM
ncbi:MAG: CorA family divalent cation transporter [Dokdonella sp.]|uniref:CorA family divalent cation transporter n=1 Tax=Dokdonella sp. TaxID=2291710 RepID=UPI003F7ED282